MDVLQIFILLAGPWSIMGSTGGGCTSPDCCTSGAFSVSALAGGT